MEIGKRIKDLRILLSLTQEELAEKVREEIRILLNELKEEKCNNLIIFIDELDRCRPTYTLKIIEMIKHYLKMENILSSQTINSLFYIPLLIFLNQQSILIINR